MGSKKPKFDPTSPEAKVLIDDIVHGTYVREGMMVAFPTCFPGVTVPITADESHITALDLASDGMVYGGTSGHRTHLFVGMFHGVTGVIFDLGTVEGADQCPAICCGKTRFVACVNGASGGRLISQPLCPLPYDLIQEWGFTRQAFQEDGEPVKGERILHGVADRSRNAVFGITPRHVFRTDIETSKPQVLGEIDGSGRIAVGSQGGIFGRDGASHLWRCDPTSLAVTRRAVALPKGRWDQLNLVWARDNTRGLLYTVDGEGTLFSFSEEHGFSSPLARTPLVPVSAMAVTLDGRLFGFCGPQLSQMFGYHPASHEVINLGVAASVLQRRRYGYVFGDAVTGRDGQIFFGEDDDLGHLWLYFPRIQSAAGS